MDFNTIYNKHYTELYHFARKQIEVSTEVADVLQDVFTKLHCELQSGSCIENPRAWLYKVLINSLRTQYRAGKSRAIKNNEIAQNNPLSTDIHESYVMNERHNIIIKAISEMPEKEKNILLLYHNGSSYQEISDIMNINYTSVGTYIARSVEKLKTILKTQYNELFD